jgi:fumarate hydratase class I
VEAAGDDGSHDRHQSRRPALAPGRFHRQEDFIASVAGALQYISYYHPVDYITSLAKAYEREQSHAAKDAIAQILINSRMCAEGHRPICQDTGIVNAFVKVGMDVRFEPAPGEELDLQEMVDEGVRRAYLDPDNKLRASLLADPAGKRKNTKDNTPAVVNVELVKGDKVDLRLRPRAAGQRRRQSSPCSTRQTPWWSGC